MAPHQAVFEAPAALVVEVGNRRNPRSNSTVNTHPRVSVVMPVLNGASVVRRSAVSVLMQSMADFELIVVDDGSTDGTGRMVEALEDSRCILLTQRHSGVSAARNAGIAHAHGQLIVFLDADDEVDESWLARLVEPFDDSRVALVCCGGIRIETGGTLQSMRPHRSGGLIRDFTVLFLAGAFMVRADVLRAAGGFGPLRYGENYDLGFRIARVLRERGLLAVALDDELVRWFGDDARSATRDAARLESAEYTLARYEQELTPEDKAQAHRIAAVNAGRMRRRALALRHGLAAVRAQPYRLDTWRTLGGVIVGHSSRESRPRVAAPEPLANPSGSPLVSVLMPTFNAASTLEHAIGSILAQTFTDFELLVVDDGSTDETPAVLAAQADPRIRVVRLPQNEGLVAALNRGLADARGALVARLDADDVALPERLGLQVGRFRDRPALVLSACAADRVDAGGVLYHRSVPPASHAALATAMLVGNRVIHPATVFHRDVALSVGGYSSDAYPAEDYDLWLRMMRCGEAEGLPQIGVRCMSLPDGISSTNSSRQMEAMERISPMGAGYPPGLARVRRLSMLTRRLRRDLRRRGISRNGSVTQWRTNAFAAARGGRATRWLTVATAAPDLLIASVVERR